MVGQGDILGRFGVVADVLKVPSRLLKVLQKCHAVLGPPPEQYVQHRHAVFEEVVEELTARLDDAQDQRTSRRTLRHLENLHKAV